MKKLFALSLFTLIFALGVADAKSQALTQQERDLLLNKLEKGRKDLEAATKGLSPAQLSFKPNFFRWSVADCVEHIALTEDFLFARVQQIMKSPAQTAAKDPAKVAESDKTLIAAVGNRSTKFMAPEPIRPQHHAPTGDLLKQFAASRTRTIEFTKSSDGLRTHCARGPAGGDCADAYQWLILMAAHTERHLAQLLEVKADPNFPKQ